MMRRPLRFLHADAGVVAEMMALIMPVILGFAALAVEMGHGLLIRDENQRVADLAAYAAAMAYESTNSTATMQSVAQNVAALNGISSGTVTATLLASSPRNSGNPAVQIFISTSEALLLAPAVGFASSMNIDATSYAEIPAGPGACIIALEQGGTGVTLSGGTSVTGSSCAVASNNSIAVPCGDYITASAEYYYGAAPTVGCSGGMTGPASKLLTADPAASNAGVIAAAARAVSAASLTAPTVATPATGTNVSFDWTNSAVAAVKSAGCTASFSGSTWTVACASGGTYNFGAISLGGGITVNFDVNDTTSTYNFSGLVDDSGTALHFGSGVFNLGGGLATGGGSATSFGSGTFNIGAASSTCNGAGRYSICHMGTTLTFGGPSTFTIAGGIYNSGGETMTLGSGSTNSFSIGPASDGNAINIGGGATTTFADATGSGDLFQVVGNIYEGGGSCTTISAATYHDIDGNANMAGGLSLGSGTYAVSGYFAAGANNGGDVWCAAANANVGVTGTNVTLAVAGDSAIANNGASYALFIGAGFNHVTISAPTSGTFAKVAIVGPTSASNTYGASVTEGASATTLGGLFYFPNGPLTLNGGATVSYGAGECLEIIASQVTLSGGTSLTGSLCFAASSANLSPVLVE